MFRDSIASGAIVALTLLCVLDACGGGGHSAPPTYMVGGTVSGLAAGSSLTLTNSGGDALTVSSNGAFAFKTPLSDGASYSAVISSLPAQQTCTLTKGSGVVSGAAVSTIALACIGPFTVGGRVTGLSANSSISLTDNADDALSVTANGAFTFATSLKPGSSYAVAVAKLPTGEQCALSGGTGNVTTGNYAGVSIVCAIPTLELLAGGLGGSGSADGSLSTARFSNPTDVAVDVAGNLYVADDFNALIRKIDTLGAVTTLAGKARQMGTEDGAGASARFSNPLSVAVDPSGNVYVVDGGVNTIRRISPSGVVSTLAGTPLVHGTADGTGASAQFMNPGSIRWAANGSLYLTDAGHIRNITANGVVTTVYAQGYEFSGLDASQPGTVYVSDDDTKAVFKIDLATRSTATIATSFENPVGIVLAPPSSSMAGTLYVADEFSCTVDAISTTGVVSTVAGTVGDYGYADGTGAAARFWIPSLMTLNSAGNILLADADNNLIRQITLTGIVTTVGGKPTQAGSADGVNLTARFNAPVRLVADSAGNLFVGDSNGIRKITPNGQVTTLFTQSNLAGLATDGKGNFYFSSISNNNSIQRLAADGTVSNLAGSQYIGFADGTGAAAGFDRPQGLAIDAQGDILVADAGNATIRRITPAGVVTTLAGRPGSKGSADGTGAAASFMSPVSIAVDASGTLFVVDGNSIRTISPSGVVATLAGSQTAGSADGSGPAAQFDAPAAVTVGTHGSIFVSDAGNSTIREVSAVGVVTTLAGTAGSAGVKPGPLPAGLNLPADLVYVGSTLYVDDAGENSVLAISGVFQ